MKHEYPSTAKGMKDGSRKWFENDNSENECFDVLLLREVWGGGV
jgi:hypothetical protein